MLARSWIGYAAPTVLVVATLVASSEATAQQLENSTTKATSGTNGTATQGRASGANLSDGESGPASETKMPASPPATVGAGHGPAQAGAPDTTKELFQH